MRSGDGEITHQYPKWDAFLLLVLRPGDCLEVCCLRGGAPRRLAAEEQGGAG